MLQYEGLIYEKLQGNIGFSNVYWRGVEGDFYALVMDLQGPCLASLFKFCDYHFDIKTILWIAIQMIQRVQFLHENHIIHRDLKPENFLIGWGSKDANTLFLIDFGLSKRYKCPKTGEHIKQKTLQYPTGTLRYCSVNTQKCREQSRRDDLEGLGYVLLYFLKNGDLPWMNLGED